MNVKCEKCDIYSVKNGRIKSNGRQRYYCKKCNRSFLETYTKNAYKYNTNAHLVSLLKEGCGTRSISRILRIAPNTVSRRIIWIASNIQKPITIKGRTHEMDELFTFVKHKEQRFCIAYAIDRKTKEVIDFRVGRRNKRTLHPIIETLILSESKQIITDKLNIYQVLIPCGIHSVNKRGINYI